MYTQCPKCEAAFRITVDVLQQARGQVLCGSCDHAFNALDHLSEEPPLSTSSEAPRDEAEEELERSQLLETLDRLAGNEDVRIEDTGVEWRVVDESEESAENGEAQASPDTSASSSSMRWIVEGQDDVPEEEISDSAETAENPALSETAAAPDVDEQRYDDNTLLPDDFEEQHQYDPPSPPPQRRATDRFEFVVEDENEVQSDLELSEPDDWSDLLDDLSGRGPEGAPIEPPAAAADGNPAAADDAHDAPSEETSTPKDGGTVDVSSSDADEAANLAAAMGPEPDADQEIAMVASQLDDLLETMGAEPLVTPEDGPNDAEEPRADAPADDQPIPYAGDDGADGDESDPDADEPLEFAATDVPDRRDLVDADEAPGNDEQDGDESIAAAEGEPDPAAPEETALPDVDADAIEIDSGDVPDGLDLAAEETGERDVPRGQAPVDEHGDAAAEEDTDAAPQDLADDEVDAEPADVDGQQPDAPAEEDARDDEDREVGRTPTEEEDALAAMTGNMAIDADMLRAMQDADFAATMTQADGSPMVETIIMEGDHVSAELAKREARGGLEKLTDPASFLDTYISSRDGDGERAWWTRRRGLSAALILLVLLVVQIVHYSRESLATTGAFNQTIAPLYRLLGDPVTPNWNIKGWQFEATNGSTDENDSVLTIYSRLSNRTDAALPYPMVHVALTDRYEEIIGSRMLEPGDYLAGGADPERPVAAGANFTAVITIASPSPEATGFKLNVCYPAGGGEVRCAIEDFKAP